MVGEAGSGKTFQSLIGLKINWNNSRPGCGFNPWVFYQFQSLIGLKINWNISGGCIFSPNYSFQSLIGLKINWNVATNRDSDQKWEFQSLIGLKINWNPDLCLAEAA